MAGTVITNLTVRNTNGILDETFAPSAETITQATLGVHATVWNVGTSVETLSLGDLTNCGQLCFQNLDDTNYVEIGSVVATSLMKFCQLKPYEIATFPLSSATTIGGIANTAAVNVKVFGVQR